MPGPEVRYRRLSTLAEGQGRVTVTAQDRWLGHTCVLKLAPTGGPGAEALDAEAERLAGLSHPALVPLTDRFTELEGLSPTGPMAGFAMAWFDGQPLGRSLSALPLDERLASFGLLVEAVQYLHRCGLLHLDIKPSNVLVGPAGLALLDLGTARPLDSGAGEAGGTLGYAAPEVLRGQAAGVQADLFSLGVLLYELIAGRKPHGDAQGGALRAAVLAGDVVPLRACAPTTDPGLAAVVDRLLRVEVAARPSGIEALIEALRGVGVPVPLPRGAPPFVGRERELQQLERTLRRPGQVCVVGPARSGRRRLVAELCRGGRTRVLDVSGQPDPRRAMGRLALSLGAELPEEQGSPEWEEAVAAGLSRLGGPPLVVHLGRRDGRDPDTMRCLDRLARAVVSGRGRVLWTAERPCADARSVQLQPLAGAALLAIGQFYGKPLANRQATMLARTGGWPGALDLALAAEPPVPPRGTERAWEVVQALPEGFPHGLLSRLPGDLGAALPALQDAGLVRIDEHGALFPVRTRRELPEDPALREALAGLVDRVPPELDALSLVLLASRLGRPVDLRDLLGFRLKSEGPRLPLLAELAERQGARNDPLAASIEAAVRRASGDNTGAIEILEALAAPDAVDRLNLAMALRRAGQLSRAIEILDELGDDLPLPLGLVERCRAALATKDLDQLEVLLDRLRALPGVEEDTDVWLLRAQLADRRQRRGQPVEGVEEIEAWVEARPEQVVAPLLSPLAWLAQGRGDLVKAQLYLRRAVEAVDAQGLPVPAIGHRINLAALLVQLGRSAEARRVLEHALLLATRHRERLLAAQVHYALARLDLHAGRLPDATTHIASFERLTAGMTTAEIHLRGALNRAWLLLLEGGAAKALALLDGAPVEQVSSDALAQRARLRAWALLELGRAHEVLALLDEDDAMVEDPAMAPLAESLRGRAHIAVGRRHLEAARTMVQTGDEAMRPVVGEVLLAWAGEDIDPVTFPARRSALSEAARSLRGPLAAKAVRLRERMLDGPGANLDGIVALTEAMHEPRAFPEALARLVREALGAHRVLIMLRMPGLGHQLGFTELSGQQAAGIGREVMERIRGVDDVWVSGDAFADPILRESSRTVQTFELKSLLAVAIPRGDRAIGALYVDDMYRANRFDDDDIALLQRLGRAVGQMLPLMRDPGRAELVEPVDKMGVLLSEPDQVQAFDEALTMLEGSTEANLLITGPTGAGKTHLAERLAAELLGTTGVEVVVLRRGDPQMLVTQLMGSKKGEFTGAVDREGAITRCLRERKALFLDEVQNLDEVGQQILLPLLDLPRSFGSLTGASRRLTRPLHIILGTNHDVSGSRAFEVFRTDLWYRMSRIHLHLPPLADRGSEVVYQYLARLLARRRAPPPEELLHTAALFLVTHAPWPGNLRELDAFADRLVHLAELRGRRLGTDDLAGLRVEALGGEAAGATAPGGAGSLDTVLIRHVMAVLRRHEWVQKTAADELGMNPPALNKLLKRHGLLDEVRRRRSTAPPAPAP